MIRITNKKEKYTPIKVNGVFAIICFGYEPLYYIDEDGNKVETNLGTWYRHSFSTIPSFEQVKNFILTEINKITDKTIVSGFVWKDMPVWLSTENQFNYKAAYDLAFQTNGASLPTVFKLGTTEEPVYYKFDTLEELTDFYTKALTYINEQLAIGWYKKDSIDWSVYEEALKTL